MTVWDYTDNGKKTCPRGATPEARNVPHVRKQLAPCEKAAFPIWASTVPNFEPFPLCLRR